MNKSETTNNDVKDKRLNLSMENTETTLRLCDVTKESHKQLISRLLSNEENRIEIKKTQSRRQRIRRQPRDNS